MKTGYGLKNRQGGAVAVMVGISMVLLVGFLAMVIDLGHLYVAKTGLQNAADAAALSGARQLNGSANGTLVNGALVGGICCDPDSAVYKAVDAAERNKFFGNLGQETVNIGTRVESNPNIRFSRSQDGPENEGGKWGVSITTAVASPGDKYFIKVDTASGNLTTWFAPIWNIFNASTFGMAVAGRSMVDISPLVICKLNDPSSDPASPLYNPSADAIKSDLGYERGVSYNVPDVTPLGGGNKFWLDPVEAPPTPCDPNHSSEAFVIPYACTGKIGYMPVVGQKIYLNTGKTTPQLEALNSRFDQYPNSAKCDPATAPPDSNIKEYRYTDSAAGSPSRWMNTDPVQQSLTIVNQQPIPWTSRGFSSYGVLWSGSRPVAAASDVNDADVSARWATFYHAASGAATSYPQPSPYAQIAAASGVPDFILKPSAAHTAQPGRRYINVAIVECPTGAGSCQEAKVLGIGRFFMQRQATSQFLNVEFDKLLGAVDLPHGEIRLYR